MKTLTTALLCTPAYWLGAAALSLPSDTGTMNGKLRPHSHHLIELDDSYKGNASDISTLEKRKQVTVCGVTVTLPAPSTCYAFGGTALTAAFLGYTIAHNILSSSSNHDCTLHSSSLDSVTWEWFATGSNCDTTAQADTIQGGLQDYLANTGNQVCGVSCIKVTHGGTYAGYVTLAAPGYDPSYYYCGSGDTFGNCVDGGASSAGKRDVESIDLAKYE